MTDNTDRYAGNYYSANRYTCILDEGAYTPANSLDYTGRLVHIGSFATPLAVGDAVAISNDTGATHSACKGLPLVERPVNGEALVIGTVVEIKRFGNYPTAASQADTLAKRLTGRYYNTAIVEFNFGTKIKTVTVKCDGTHAVTQGDGSTLKYGIGDSVAALAYNIGVEIFDVVASGGTGIIPLHYVPAGTNGDLYSCAVLYTGAVTAQT